MNPVRGVANVGSQLLHVEDQADVLFPLVPGIRMADDGKNEGLLTLRLEARLASFADQHDIVVFPSGQFHGTEDWFLPVHSIGRSGVR